MPGTSIVHAVPSIVRSPRKPPAFCERLSMRTPFFPSGPATTRNRSGSFCTTASSVPAHASSGAGGTIDPAVTRRKTSGNSRPRCDQVPATEPSAPASPA